MHAERSLLLTHTHTNASTAQNTNRMIRYPPSLPHCTSSRSKLTQNTRLKANIRYLMHISPPDSAAMAAPDIQITLQLLQAHSSRRHNAGPST